MKLKISILACAIVANYAFWQFVLGNECPQCEHDYNWIIGDPHVDKSNLGIYGKYYEMESYVSLVLIEFKIPLEAPYTAALILFFVIVILAVIFGIARSKYSKRQEMTAKAQLP